VAVAILDPERAALLINKTLGKNLTPGDVQQLEEAAQSKEVRAIVKKNLGRVAEKHKLNGYVMISTGSCRSTSAQSEQGPRLQLG
jgi:hypothetical protein